MPHQPTPPNRSTISPVYQLLGLSSFLVGMSGGFALSDRIMPSSPQPLFYLHHSTPGTAVITGASSGIGIAFARQLAAAGYHLWLVARREPHLQALARELSHYPNMRVECIVTDLADPDQVEQLAARLAADTTITMLINNAGFGTTGTFLDVPMQKHLAMIQVHVNASVRLTHAVLPQMQARRRGAIINVSSIAAWSKAPGIVTYSATKDYLNTFSIALQHEVAEHGIQVQALCPGFTITGFHDTAEFATFDRANVPHYLWMSANAVVAASLAALPLRRVIVIPGWRNRLLVAMMHAPVLSNILHMIRKRWRRLAPQTEPVAEGR